MTSGLAVFDTGVPRSVLYSKVSLVAEGHGTPAIETAGMSSLLHHYITFKVTLYLLILWDLLILYK